MEEEDVKKDPEKKSILQIRVQFSVLEKDTKDPFMRYWTILSNLEQARIGPEYEGHLAKVFVDIDTKCNTIWRKFYEVLVSQGLKCVFTLGQVGEF